MSRKATKTIIAYERRTKIIYPNHPNEESQTISRLKEAKYEHNNFENNYTSSNKWKSIIIITGMQQNELNIRYNKQKSRQNFKNCLKNIVKQLNKQEYIKHALK